MGGRETIRVKELADQFPPELKRANKAMNNDLKRAIVVLLLDEGPLPFSEIRDKLSTETDELHQGFLSEALQDLRNGRIVNRSETGDFSDRYQAVYEVGEFGSTYLDCLLDSIDPREEKSLNPTHLESPNDVIDMNEIDDTEVKNKTAKSSKVTIEGDDTIEDEVIVGGAQQKSGA